MQQTFCAVALDVKHMKDEMHVRQRLLSTMRFEAQERRLERHLKRQTPQLVSRMTCDTMCEEDEEPNKQKYC